MKVGCLIYRDMERYDFMEKVAKSSFEHFHEDVSMFSLTAADAQEKYKNTYDLFSPHGAGILKFALGAMIMRQEGLDKIILLGADTITLDRMTEFISNDDYDILTTLDFPYACGQNGVQLSGMNSHYNSDMTCFNSSDALIAVVKASLQFSRVNSRDQNIFGEQGGLNYVCNVSRAYSHFCIDGVDQDICYNVKSKGRNELVPPLSPENRYKVQDEKVYTKNGMPVKAYHYCCAMSIRDDWEDLWMKQNAVLGEDVLNLIEKISGYKLERAA